MKKGIASYILLILFSAYSNSGYSQRHINDIDTNIIVYNKILDFIKLNGDTLKLSIKKNEPKDKLTIYYRTPDTSIASKLFANLLIQPEFKRILNRGYISPTINNKNTKLKVSFVRLNKSKESKEFKINHFLSFYPAVGYKENIFVKIMVTTYGYDEAKFLDGFYFIFNTNLDLVQFIPSEIIY